ncbi:MAG TPA: SDR family NAD(P)-dependent oxidoreductase [Thermoleophilia bacterium]|nr:SDR family NAD(P)-dependent oxidoreductase [Thermoleophilia bacterium]
MRLEGKVALITGGNSGVGRGIVHRFVDEGARVAFVGRDECKGAAVADELKRRNGTGAFFAVDLAREDAVAALVDDVARLYGGIDIVVNVAGLGAIRSGVEVGDRPGTRWDKLRGPNLDSAYFVSAYALPLLKRAGGGAIVNISSTGALHGNWGLYCVAKAAVEGLTRALAAEGAPHGIRANCVSPGWIETETDAEQRPSGSGSGEWANPPSLLGRMGTPAEIAAAVLFLASEEASFVTGQTLIVDGGLSVIDYPSLSFLDEVGDRLYSGRV